ncbi:hypothetical protein [Actinomadura rubrisoli]|uniref:Uncharacterized protein n=1 Tax=Actinomadura rubrisoli TaxID=2530368 RepID=A0A4R5A2J9_9ACTN|nr:hypothetical protein [Actinomadura rubrisoli]TDD65675.1 hypothetical protein E1298_41160 [Actinomadura rubrisoli]
MVIEQGVHPHAYPHLASLQARLNGQGFKTRLDSSSLIVIARQDEGPRLADTITCRRRDSDGGRLWFWTSWGEPIAEAEHIVDAAVIIAANLGPQP